MTKTQKVIYYVLLVLVSAAFLMASIQKLMGNDQAIAGFTMVGLPVWFCYFIGVCEVLGVIGLWIKKTQKLAAWGLMIIMASAVVVTLMEHMGAVAILPLIVGIILWYITRLAKKRDMNAPAAPMDQAPATTV
jgi:putative oxidoreductase